MRRFRQALRRGAFSAVILAMGALVAGAGAAFGQAQDQAQGNASHSTPQEIQQTQNLNAQSQVRAVQSDAAQQHYQQQLDRYHHEQSDYMHAREQYAAQRHRYEIERNAYYIQYTDDHWALPKVAPPLRGAGLSRVSLVADPVLLLARAPVVDGDGDWAGRVQRVETAPDGRARRILVILPRDGLAVWVQSRDLRYDPADGVLFSDLDYEALRHLPGHEV